jgi:hypothetical protein
VGVHSIPLKVSTDFKWVYIRFHWRDRREVVPVSTGLETELITTFEGGRDEGAAKDEKTKDADQRT